MAFIILRYAIASVWLVNGLWCKVLNGVPRHQQIVGRILGESQARLFTKLIGFGEIVMAIWVCSNYAAKICAALQIALVLAMNCIEFVRAKDLLLFGRRNILVAVLFTAVIGWSSFIAH